MKIPFVSFEAMHKEIEPAMLQKFQEVYEKNWFIQGSELEAFEKEFAAYCGADYCVGCGNGLDALMLILKAYGIGAGDEVIVPSNTFIATALAVSYTGATPVFVEPSIETYTINPAAIEEKITPSQITTNTDKHGNITYSFYVNGIALTAQVVVNLSAGSNYANATVYPMMNGNNLTFSGTLVPTSQSGIFRSGFISY